MEDKKYKARNRYPGLALLKSWKRSHLYRARTCSVSQRTHFRRARVMNDNYFFGLGHLASTVVPIPPRGRNTPFTTAHLGLQARATSSSTWFTMFS
jgi:hypothetical protein